MVDSQGKRGRWFRIPYVFATIGGGALLAVGVGCLLQTIWFTARGAVVTARVASEDVEVIGRWGGLFGRELPIKSRRVTYEFKDPEGKSHVGKDGWNGRPLKRGDLLEIQFIRSDPESNRVHPDFGSDWLGGLLFLAGGCAVLTIPRFSKSRSRSEEWEEFEQQRDTRGTAPRNRVRDGLPTGGMVLAFLGCIAAFLITAWAAICVVATFATSDYRPILAQATGWSLLSLVVLLAAWSRLERGSRIFAIVITLVDVAVLFESIARWVGVI